ncbi:hypothetical protein [Sphingomonas sp.]|uniref:hypothetical protein n=1 Tax=Sphingomonas sp. TaxID=28214 RepID=UPI0025D484C8|nr:hypothetical protein [Sphingomonas sp.]MBV9527215.1 hypothetical protein [Sphingomonas sp.]
MALVAKRLLRRSAAASACAAAFSCASPALADPQSGLLSPDTFQLSADMRLVAVDGERSWVDGGFGKLRSGSDGSLRAQPQLGNLTVAWQPRLTFSLGATVTGVVQGGQRTEAGLGQAFLTYKPMRGSTVALSARAGLMWPAISLEHEGADWHVRDSITPSAINSWVGEEVRPVAAEGTAAISLGRHTLRVTAAAMAANETSGTLLTFRGWALHDRVTLAFHRQPLPPLEGELADYQPRFTHPLIDLHAGFADRLGYYVKLAWQPPVPVRIELFRYDNRADPEDVNGDSEWGWRTRFDQVAAAADLGGGLQLKGQALSGTTRMGYVEGSRRWVDGRFRSAYLLATRPFGPIGLAARVEAFDTRNSGSLATKAYDERGTSEMIAGKHDWRQFTGLVELLHVSSRREEREELGIAPRQSQTQLQAEMRMRW